MYLKLLKMEMKKTAVSQDIMAAVYRTLSWQRLEPEKILPAIRRNGCCRDHSKRTAVNSICKSKALEKF